MNEYLLYISTFLPTKNGIGIGSKNNQKTILIFTHKHIGYTSSSPLLKDAIGPLVSPPSIQPSPPVLPYLGEAVALHPILPTFSKNITDKLTGTLNPYVHLLDAKGCNFRKGTAVT